jgi:hypothetical protein
VTVIALVVGLLLLAAILQDAFEVMLLPRRVPRRLRLMRLFFRLTWGAWKRLSRWQPNQARREKFLGIYGPLSMVLLFALWGGSLIAGFGAIEWALQRGQSVALNPTIGSEIYMSGVTFFTLGYGDVVPHTSVARFVAVLEAGTGIGFIAVVIGYLPVLYQLFSRREAHVIQLDARAGSPPTAVTMLCRHAESGGGAKLDELLRAWEIWGADLLESHLSYPMLAYYRSQHDDQSWLAALVAIMDTCVIILVGVDGIPPLQARMTFAMARQVVLELARSLGVTTRAGAEASRLDHASFLKMEALFAQAEVSWQAGSDAEDTLAAVRATYEPFVLGLAEHLAIAIPDWIPSEETPDHWERGPRGIIARRLIESLSEKPASIAGSQGPRRTFARRLRNRLK